MPLSDEEESRLRTEIERRIKPYASRDLKTERMRDILQSRGPVGVLEEYATADPDQVSGWKRLVRDEPELTLEWLVLNDPAAYRETSDAAHEAASWKLDRPGT
jgi:hypothetical protein